MRYKLNFDLNNEFIVYLIENLPIGLIKDLYERYQEDREDADFISLVDGMINTQRHAPNLKPITDTDIANIRKVFDHIKFGNRDEHTKD